MTETTEGVGVREGVTFGFAGGVGVRVGGGVLCGDGVASVVSVVSVVPVVYVGVGVLWIEGLVLLGTTRSSSR